MRLVSTRKLEQSTPAAGTAHYIIDLIIHFMFPILKSVFQINDL